MTNDQSTDETRDPNGSIMLTVAEAPAKDVGRGLARIDPKDLERLGIAIGDVVEIVDQQSAVARVMPAYAAERGRGLIQIDGILRANAGASLDDRVAVRPVKVQPARQIVLSPIERLLSVPKPSQMRYLSRLLDGIPVKKDNRVRVNLFGSRAQTFAVVESTPEAPVIIGSGTTIRIAGEGKEAVRSSVITYEDIGGQSRELRRVREMIELPLRYPEIFERLGIDPPRGVLLHGPPGSGKTLIARAVAHETNAYYLHVNGPEIIDKWYGSSEAQLRSIFEEARKNAPAIIFIDEIDAIAPKREEMGGERQVERRVVAQLLALMDGLESRGNVIVIAATNIPNMLDPALRRPGRFDREIAISVPDREGRREILEIHTRGMPLADDVSLDRLSAITHGFVGADLAAICREAAMSSLRRELPQLDLAQVHRSYDKLMNLQVAMDDFISALSEVQPSAIREVFTEVPDVDWADVGGLDSAKQLLIESVEWPLNYDWLFKKSGVRSPRGILMYGPPGTGKTLLAKALAKQSEVNFIAVKGPELLSMWVGDSERRVREVFRKAKLAAPCLIFFDEIDALAVRRGGGDGAAGSEVSDRLLSQLLTELDGIEELKGVVVLAATNRVDRLDPALLRPGRFDFLVEIPLADFTTRLAIFRIHTHGMALETDVDLEALAAECEGFSGADIAGLCHRASLLAIREYMQMNAQRLQTQRESYQRGFNDADAPQLYIGRRHFKLALERGRS